MMTVSLNKEFESGPEVTVVITCRERYQLTEAMIDQVVRTTSLPIRLLYIDAGDPDWLRDKIAHRSREWSLEVIRFDEPLWPTQARRRAAGLIDTKYAVFMDNDVLVHPGWLEQLYACAEQTGAGIVGPLYLWGSDAQSDTIHMAGGELILEQRDDGVVLKERHRHINKKLDQVALLREECGFMEFHCMLMRREVYREPSVFDESIVCVHEHINASLVARELGFKTVFEPAAKIVYLAFSPYSLSDLPVFRWRWSHEAGESSIKAFSNRWGIADDERSFGGVRKFLDQHRSKVDPVRHTIQESRISQSPMQEGELRQTLTGLMELALSRGYTAQDLERMDEAHWIALWLSNGGYRPCGRPFINHLVGTASVLVHYGFEVRLVQAALLHSAYTHAPHSGSGAKATIDAVTHRLGGLTNGVERAVRAYTLRSRRWHRLSNFPNWQDMATMADIDTAILALANDIDMHLSGEIRVTGRADMDGEILSKARDICQIVGVPGMAEVARTQPGRNGTAPIPRKYHPKGSVRIVGADFVDMVNPAFFQIQNSTPAVKGRRHRFFSSVRALLENRK